MTMRAGRPGQPGTERDLFAVVGRRFRPGQMLGSEGAFFVQLATDVKNGSNAVVKRPKDPLNRRSLASLAVEAAALSRLAHPGIPRLLGAALDCDDPHIAMEHMEGVRYNLNNIMDERLACVVRLTISACNVLSAAHREGIVHRDICPANIVMGQRRDVLRVIDFGVAFVPGMPDLGADRLVGRPDFMAPEQASPGARVDGRADVYSLGVMAYMYLSGHSPFIVLPSNDEAMLAAHRTKDPIHLSRVAGWLPPGLVRTVMRSISRDPSGRFADASEFASALSDCLEPLFP
jgi:serine/threonine protein kinase